MFRDSPFYYSAFPCRDCKDRERGCHDRCERYQNAKAARKVKVDAIIAKKKAVEDAEGHIIETKSKIRHIKTSEH